MKYIFCILLFLLPGILPAQSRADSMLNFMRSNPAKFAVYLVRNDTVLAKHNENRKMPLASTVKILVAVEFAKQAGANVIDPEEMVPVSALDKYYIPFTDGNAHPMWKQFEERRGHIKNDSISLMNVARGMTMFSSNANTDYLIERLGLDNVNNNTRLFGLKDHTPVYPVVASLFVYQNPKNRKEEQIIKDIRKLSDEQYARFIYGIHMALRNDTVLKPKFRPMDLTLNMQRAWSDRLPASTVRSYAHIASSLNNRRYFDQDTYGVIAEILEFIMENPANAKWLKHAGMKGGSTNWVLTKTMYATTKEGNRFELAYFFNDLTQEENNMLSAWMNDFELAILTRPDFVKKVMDTW